MDEGKALKEDILWLMHNGHMEMALSCILEAEDLLVVTDWLALKCEWQIRQQLFCQARETLSLGLAQDPCHQDLLELSLFLANEVEQDENERQRVVALLRMLTGLSVEAENNSLLKPIQKTRILHGTMEIANQMNTLVTSLKKKGYTARSVNYYQSYLNYEEDQDISFSDCRTQEEINIKTKVFAAKMLSEYDIFHFHFGTSLTMDQSDIPIIKQLNKKTFMHFWGSEIRRLSIAKQHNPYVIVKESDENIIMRQIESIARYIDDCIVCDQELALYVKGIFNKIHVLPLAIDLGKFQPKVKNVASTSITIVHAPTHFGVKGTEVILSVMEKLSNEFKIDFKLVQGVAHSEAKKIYQEADLVIDQIRIGCHGVFALECMAMGKPVIAWTSDFMKNQYPADLPVISANPDTLEKVLRFILQNRDALPDIGRRGIAYVEKYHDVEKVGNTLLGLYDINRQ